MLELLGIEILCIGAAEIGENSGLYLFGFNLVGIPIAYAMGYALAGFTTFIAILGRYNYGSNRKIHSCCLCSGAGRRFRLYPEPQNHLQKLCYWDNQAAASTQTTKLEVYTENKRIHFGYC